MSALAMILTAAIVVPGNGPKEEPAEMVRALDLSGEWEGTGQSTISKSRLKISRGQGHIDIQAQRGAIGADLKIIDEGEAKLRIEVKVCGTVRRLLGIYKWQGDRLLICCRQESKGRPTSFMVDEVNCLLLLHRLKPRR